jgi:hypothetical protein
MAEVNVLLASAAILGAVTMVACTSDEPTKTTPIRSAADLSAYLQTVRESPLDRMEPETRQRFLDSLVFGEHEIGGFEYRDLQSLPADDVYQVLHLFGAERTMPIVMRGHVPSAEGRIAPRAKPSGDDHKDYSCVGPHNCASNTGWICMTGC